MKRACLFVSAAVIVLAMGCGGGPAPTSPSHAAAESPAGTTTMSPSSAPALFGASAVDFARCLQAAGDSGCFTASARMQARAVGGSATAPGAPTNLSTSSSGSTVTLTWGAPASGDPVSTYLIEAGSGPGLANLANFPTNSTAMSFSASGIGTGTYYVRVRAQNATGTSGASNESALVVGSSACTSAPGAPGGLAITSSGSTVTLTWNAPAGGCTPTSYVLQAGASAGSSNLANSNVGNTTSYVAGGVGNGTYYVRVGAVNAFGQSVASNEVVLTVGGTPPPSSVTGRWIGLSPDGWSWPPDPACGTEEFDITLDLTQTGTNVTGTFTNRVRVSRCRTIGRVTSATLMTGTVGSGTISFTIHGGGPNEIFTFMGTFTDTRMTGTATPSDDPSLRVSFAVNRQ